MTFEHEDPAPQPTKIEIRCDSCQTTLKVASSSRGKQVRCPKCKAVIAVPTGPGADAVSRQRMPQPAMPTLVEDSPAPSERRRKRSSDDIRRPEKSGMPIGLIVALSLGIGFLVAASLGAVVVVSLLAWEPKPIAAPVAVAVRPPIIEEAPEFKPDNRVNREFPDDADLGPFAPNAPREFRPPAVPKPVPPTKVELKNGVFTTKVTWPPDWELRRGDVQFEFQAKANTVYWVKTDPPFAATVHLQGPADLEPNRNDSLHGQAILAKEAGPWLVHVDANDVNKPRTMTIREMDGSEALPIDLRVNGPLKELPQFVKLDVFRDNQQRRIYGAVFDPMGKFFLTAHEDRTLVLWDAVNVAEKGRVRTKAWMHSMGIDRAGRLYGQMQPVQTSGHVTPHESRPAGDISVWENLKLTDNNALLPEPTRTIPLRGIVTRFVNSPGGDHLYFFDNHNRQLCRIDPATGTVDKTIDTIAAVLCAFCMTPDGKKIYCGGAGKIDVIDPTRFAIERTVSIGDIKILDMAATNAGRIYVVTKASVSKEVRGRTNCAVIDMSGPADRAPVVAPLSLDVIPEFVAMLPDERAVLYSGDRRMCLGVPVDQPALYKSEFREAFMQDFFTPVRSFISPNGRLVVFGNNSILSVGR